MISFLSNWIEQITISIITVSIFELILPKGNLKKYIKVVLGIYIIFCIISPFVNTSKLYDLENFDTNKLAKEKSSSVNQESMDKRLQNLYIDELKKDISKKVNENGYNVEKIDIDANLQQDSENPGIHNIDLVITNNKIESVKKVEIGNKKEDETKQNNENIEKIKEELEKDYEVDKKIINVKLE